MTGVPSTPPSLSDESGACVRKRGCAYRCRRVGSSSPCFSGPCYCSLRRIVRTITSRVHFTEPCAACAVYALHYTTFTCINKHCHYTTLTCITKYCRSIFSRNPPSLVPANLTHDGRAAVTTHPDTRRMVDAYRESGPALYLPHVLCLLCSEKRKRASTLL